MKCEKHRLGTLIVNFDRLRKPLSSLQRSQRHGKYPYYGATSIMDYVDDYIFDGTYILLGEDGTVVDGYGHPILQIASGKFWCNNHAHVLKNTDIVDFDYLYYLLKGTIVSENSDVYQIFAYVKNMDKDNTGNVAGLLLYAKTEEEIVPDCTFNIGGNQISAKTLDLNKDFSLIAKQLDQIAEDYFGKQRCVGDRPIENMSGKDN